MPANRGSYRPGDLKAILGAGAILGGVYQFFFCSFNRHPQRKLWRAYYRHRFSSCSHDDDDDYDDDDHDGDHDDDDGGDDDDDDDDMT